MMRFLKYLFFIVLGLMLCLVVLVIGFGIAQGFYQREAEKKATAACNLVVYHENIAQTIEKFKRHQIKYYYWKDNSGAESLTVEAQGFIFDGYECHVNVKNGIVEHFRVYSYD